MAIVTGGAGINGLGFASARLMVQHGARIVIQDLPYRGLGSGLLRVLRAWPQTEPIDDPAGNLFKAIMARPEPSRTR